MKTNLKVGALLLLTSLLLCSVAVADPPGTRRSKSKTLINDDQERYVRVTGSNIPQRVTLKSIGTNTPYNLRIYTKEEMDRTGRFTPAGALALDPSITITGR